MPISGSTALVTVAAPSIQSPAPYKIYTITNATGILLSGFTIANTGNIPTSLTIYQDSLQNAIYSVTLAALQGTPGAATAALQQPVIAAINGNLRNFQLQDQPQDTPQFDYSSTSDLWLEITNVAEGAA